MKMTRIVVVVSILSVLIGCGQESSNIKEKQGLKSVVPQANLDALDKAKDVEQALKEAAEKRTKEMEEKGT